MRTRFSFLVVLLLIAALPAAAQICINPVVGVFGQANKPPHWWNASGEPGIPDPQPVYHTCLRDPRWRDAAAITYDSGAGENMLFRMLHDTNNVYVSWWVKSTPFATPDQNLVYFGFPTTGGHRVVKMTLATAVPTDAGGGANLNLATFLRDPVTGHGMPGEPIPAWLSETARVWINNPMSVCKDGVNYWGYQVRIPKSVITSAASQFKFWYQVYTGTLGMPVVKFTWPRTGADITEGGFPVQEIYPDPAVWQTFQYSTGPGDPGCPGAGVDIGYYSVGTKNTPDNRIRYAEVPADAATHPVNTFFARPTNNSGQDIPAGGIRATFRIANWGSQPHWEDGVPIDVLWSRIQCGTDGNPNLTDCGTDVPNVAQINNGTTATAANEIRFDWALTNNQLAPFKSGAKRADNCMIVELSSNMSPGLVFRRRSVLRNMVFAHASIFEHEAEANIRGLTPISAIGRDIYIWVEMLNMPRNVDPEAKIPQIPVSGLENSTVGGGRTVGVNDDRLLRQLQAEGRIDEADLEAAMPTYRVHVYHDTGKKRNIAGVERPVLNAQGVFGYYVAYNPPVTGWRTDLQAAGFSLEELAPNFYRIARVPNNGTVPLKIRIQALGEGEQPIEEGGGGPGGGPGPGPSPSGQWRFFVDAGINDPDAAVDGKFSINAGIERMITANWSVEGILGYHGFDGAFVDPDIWQLSANAKYFFGTTAFRPFVNGGAGIYRVDPPDDTEFGFNAGAGLLYQVNSKWGVEGVYNMHFTDPVDWWTLQLGLRWSF